jgi:hypothetical protein
VRYLFKAWLIEEFLTDTEVSKHIFEINGVLVNICHSQLHKDLILVDPTFILILWNLEWHISFLVQSIGSPPVLHQPLLSFVFTKLSNIVIGELACRSEAN